jgi:TolB protein
VAFITYRDEGTSLAVASADGGNPTTVYASDALLNRPEWSPSGDELVFVADPLGVSSFEPGRMFRVSARGGRPQEIRIPNDIWPLERVAWSPAGDALVFSGSASNYRHQLFAMRPDGSGLRRLTRSDETDDYSPDWSPDGRRIAFTRSDVGPRGDPGVFVVDRGGGEASRVGSYGDCCAVWSPDGRMLLVERKGLFDEEYSNGPPELWIVDVESGEERRLAPAPAADADWSSADPP